MGGDSLVPGRGGEPATGTPEYLIEIYETFYKKIYAYSVYRLFKREFAEDVTSQVFLHLVEQGDSLKERSRAEISSWLYATANNLINNDFRTRNRRGEILKDVAREIASRSGDDHATHRLDWPILYKAISRLKGDHQNVVVLRYFEGLEPAAIAEVLRIKPGTVRVMLSRATKKLRSELEDSFEA